ncbi:hypothetical protein B0H11DRAFT_1975493 [Mycena galericulata]|nr:hypothetical protein B0H11DRAFT_1975493 [Mycena galericulata]
MAEQNLINHIVLNPTYTPRIPIVLEEGLKMIQDGRHDADLLDCLETLGDSRVGYLFTKLFFDMFPLATPRECRRVRNWVLSNKTLQIIAHKMGIDPEPAEVFNKGSGDAVEIILAVLDLGRPQAAKYFVNDLLTPLIRAVMDRGDDSLHMSSALPQEPKRKRQRRNPRPDENTPITPANNTTKMKGKGKALTAKPMTPVGPSTLPSVPFTFFKSLPQPLAIPAPSIFSTDMSILPEKRHSIFGVPTNNLFHI